MKKLLFVLLAACTGGSDLDIDGDWREDWSCEETCDGGAPMTITGSVEMTLSTDGSTVTRTDGDGTTWEGTLSGNELTLSTSDGTYSEDSVFIFDDAAESFTLTSEYAFGTCSGTCTGTGERVP